MTKEDAREFVKFIIISLLIVGTIRIFIIEPYKILGQSMSPTFTGIGNERVAIWKLGELQRGDIVVVKPPDQKEKIIKRVIGLPGEKIQIRDNGVYINSEKLEEPYIPDGVPTTTENHDIVTLATNEYYVLGDNRVASHDSRRIGPITKNQIVGRAIFQYSPRSAIHNISRDLTAIATMHQE